MAVELSFDMYGPSPHDGFQGSLALWAATATLAAEPCVVVDHDGNVVAASPGCGDLFAFDVNTAVHRSLTRDVLLFCDFNAVSGGLPDWEVKKVPPLLAISSGLLARGLVRVRGGNGLQTVDAISVPLREGEQVVGSLTFFAPVNQ